MNNKVSSWKMIIRNLFYVFFTGVVLLWFSSSSFAWNSYSSKDVGETGIVQKIVKDGEGNARIVFEGGPGIDTSYHAVGESWTMGSVLFPASGTTNLPTSRFDVSMNADGDYIVAVIVYDLPSTNPHVRAYLSSEGFIDISSNVQMPTSYMNINVAMSNNGDAIVVWEDENDIRYRMYRNGSWGSDTLLDSGSTAVGQLGLDVACDENGNFTVVWFRETDNMYARRFFNGSWGSVVTIAEPDTGGMALPRVTMYGNGEAIMVWEHHSTLFRIYARRYNGSTWLPSENISGTGSNHARIPKIASQQDGTAMVVYKEGSGAQWKIYANRFSGGSWDGPEEIGCDLAAVNFNVDMDGYGNAVAAFAASGFYIVRSYQAGSGWLDCNYQGAGALNTGDSGSQNLDKRVVITPHEILGVYPFRVLPANPHAYGMKAQIMAAKNNKDLMQDQDITLIVERAEKDFSEKEVFHYKILKLIRLFYKLLIASIISFMLVHQILDYMATRRHHKSH